MLLKRIAMQAAMLPQGNETSQEVPWLKAAQNGILKIPDDSTEHGRPIIMIEGSTPSAVVKIVVRQRRLEFIFPDGRKLSKAIEDLQEEAWFA